jgi:GNAT superfamily N-acetyltransferase
VTGAFDAEIRLRPASADDVPFVYESLTELRGGVDVSPDMFHAYCGRLFEEPDARILIADAGGRRVGAIALNRFAMPRYAGYGYEIEEFVVVRACRRKGVGRRMLELVIERCGRDPLARKIVVKSNRAGARLYRTIMSPRRAPTFQHLLNMLPRTSTSRSARRHAVPHASSGGAPRPLSTQDDHDR